MSEKLDIKDVDSIEVDLMSNTVKCLTKNGFILWQIRKHTKEEAMEVARIVNEKREVWLKSISTI